MWMTTVNTIGSTAPVDLDLRAIIVIAVESFSFTVEVLCRGYCSFGTVTVNRNHQALPS